MENIQSVAIYDVIGREIYSQDAINAKEFSKTNVVQNTQTLLIKITLANGVVVSKKIVYKG
jgi:flagellar hook assembly protein FlgD